MINKTELIGRLEEKYPGIALRHLATSMKNDVYKLVGTFTDLACEVIKSRDTPKVKEFLSDAFEFWKDGCYEIKNAICNEFLYTISILMDTKPDINNMLQPIMCDEFKMELHKMHFSSLP